MPMIDPDSSIPELIKFIRHSFREYEFVEVENILVNRENSRKVGIENLVKEVDSLKELVAALENTQSQTVSEKCSLEEKLEMVQRRGDKLIVEMEEKIEKLEDEKSDLEVQLAWRSTKCEEMYENLVTISKIEKLTKMRADELHKLILEKGEKIEKLEREKSDLEKKLVLSSRNCEELYEENLVKNTEIDKLDRMRAKELDKLTVEKGKKIEKLEREKSDLEKKLVLSTRKCEEMYEESLVKMAEIEKLDKMRAQEFDKLIVEKWERIVKLEGEKLDLEKKLLLSSRKYDEMDQRLVKMGKEIEELRRENDCANKIIVELKAKEVESDRAVQELKRENVDALHTINELRVKKMESEKDLNTRISMSENVLAEILGVNVNDFPTLLNAYKDCTGAASENNVEEDVEFVEGGLNNLEIGQMTSDAEDRVVVSPDDPAVSGVRDLLHSETEEDDANRVAAKSTAIVHENEDETPGVIGSHREKIAVPSSSIPAGSVVIEISDGDSDDETVPSKKRRRSNSTQPCGLPSSSNVEERQEPRIDTVDLVELEDD